MGYPPRLRVACHQCSAPYELIWLILFFFTQNQGIVTPSSLVMTQGGTDGTASFSSPSSGQDLYISSVGLLLGASVSWPMCGLGSEQTTAAAAAACVFTATPVFTEVNKLTVPQHVFLPSVMQARTGLPVFYWASYLVPGAGEYDAVRTCAHITPGVQYVQDAHKETKL